MSCPYPHAARASKVSAPTRCPHAANMNKLNKLNDEDQPVGEGVPIPQPPQKLLIGNLGEIDPNFAISSFWRLADVYGPIYRLNLVKRNVIVISNHELISEVCDDTHYEKYVTGVQETVRVFVKNGLFTSYGDEEEWGIAHRTLVPAFGPLHVREMFPQMTDILSQMVLRWDRFGSDHVINTMDDFTRLAFDVIGLCAFNYRFNAFYSEDLIPFAKQLGQVLIETGRITNRTDVSNLVHFRGKKQMMDNIHAMWKVCDDIVADRRANPRPDVNDILNVMLSAKDPVTGKGFSDENIRYQMATFLVAGHDTSAGTLMFLFYNLLQHPDKLQKCYDEIDAVVGNRPLEVGDLSKLPYIEACMRETLRFLGPIGVVSRHAKKTRLLAGRYRVTPEDAIVINFRGLHHDPAVWGADCDEFRPERFLDGGWEELPSTAWKPFGTGIRACIGRFLAEQEIIMTMAMVLQRFVVEMADPSYQLKIKSTLTIKPDGFGIKMRRRPGRDHLFLFTGSPAPAASGPLTPATNVDSTDLKPLAIFYGGNAGTCKALAEGIETAAPAFGLHAPSRVQNLDEAIENLPKDRPVVIVTSSYEGLPPDNARHFVAWLEARAKDPANHHMLSGVHYAVFGTGSKDWAKTYHRIPRLVDDLMEKLGATRLVPAGFADVSQDTMGPFEDWKATLFPALRSAAGVTASVDTAAPALAVEITQPDTPSQLAGEPVAEGVVVANRVLAAAGLGAEKRQIDILLPPGVEYRSGDYLAIQPFNPTESIHRVLRRFGLHPDSLIKVSGTTKAYLLASDRNAPLSVYELLSTRVELATPASQRQVTALAESSLGPDATRLHELASDAVYTSEVLAKRFSVLDLLEDFASCGLSFAAYLDMLPPLSPRQYSISSSPLFFPPVEAKTKSEGENEPTGAVSLTASLTYDVHVSPSLAHPSQTFHGVASSYLASLEAGARLRCVVRPTRIPFRLPRDPLTPVIMIATGTGIAPMHAFLQDRAAIAAASSQQGAEKTAALGPALLYYGCRDPDADFLYRDELAAWESAGVVQVRSAFSRAGPNPSRVDTRLWQDREELREVFNRGARILVCGSAAGIGAASADVCLRIWEEGHPDKSRQEAEEWLREMREERFVSDVFG